jgi:hypothetical protein
MITAVQIHVRMKLHVSTHKQTIIAIVLRTGKERTAACLDYSAVALHAKVKLHDILHFDRALECFKVQQDLRNHVINHSIINITWNYKSVIF